MGSMPIKIFLFVFVVAVVIGRPGTTLAYEPDECIACHNLQSTESRLKIDVKAFSGSAHADNAGCMDCHSQVENESHTRKKGSGTVDCTACHDQQNRHGLTGLEKTRPDCYNCHTKHDILPKDDPRASIHPNKMTVTCASCHPAQSGGADYLSFLPSIKIKTHPKADLSGDYSIENCLGCHQGQAVHGEKELINEATCQRCHLDAQGKNPMLGFMHPKAGPTRQAGVFAVAIVYQFVMLFFVVGAIFMFIRKFTGTKRG
jgi:hypothetical protein